MPIERVLRDFEGSWIIARRIVTQPGDHVALFDGTGIWVPENGGLAYAETGILTMEGAPPMTATRRYRWESDLSVHFDDGRFFHRVPPAGGQTAHFCDPDSYDVVYDFGAWPMFDVTWTVNGPRKSYVMTSHYRRSGGDD
jgi:uncharacterized protein DUF6314